MLIASGMLMAGVLSQTPSCRDAAVDLLAADACVTYAFEAAADEPESFTFLADEAMRSIAKLAQ
ncbi:MAG: hypothetical protein HYV19_11425 [Gemmatimonadetes bacterium]|jgi:hypothetical protein|nr:hypothetical protein [Gemmatimonadota bacterium]